MSKKPTYTNADGTHKTTPVEVLLPVNSESATPTLVAPPGCMPGSDINISGYEVGTLGGNHHHILAFNKFPAARPHFLILTADGFRRQFEQLDGEDLWAMWLVMSRFNEYHHHHHQQHNGTSTTGNSSLDGRRQRRQRHISFFNCGLKSGCSRLHKHMQVFPILPEHEQQQQDEEEGKEFRLWPDIEDPEFYKEVLPFKVAIARFKDYQGGGGVGMMTREKLLETYRSLLSEAERYLREYAEKHGDDGGQENGQWNISGQTEKEHRDRQGGQNGAGEAGRAATIPHNVILDRDWMVVIPRRAAGWRGADGNAVSMLGMNFVSGEERIQNWVELGPAEVLRQIGVPRAGE